MYLENVYDHMQFLAPDEYLTAIEMHYTLLLNVKLKEQNMLNHSPIRCQRPFFSLFFFETHIQVMRTLFTSLNTNPPKPSISSFPTFFNTKAWIYINIYIHKTFYFIAGINILLYW